MVMVNFMMMVLMLTTRVAYKRPFKNQSLLLYKTKQVHHNWYDVGPSSTVAVPAKNQQSQKSRAEQQAPKSKSFPISSVPPQLIGTRITDGSQKRRNHERVFVPRGCLPLDGRWTTGTHSPTITLAQPALNSPARCTPPPPPKTLKYLLYILHRLPAPQIACLHFVWNGGSLKYLVQSNLNPPGVHCALYRSAAPKMWTACLCLHITVFLFPPLKIFVLACS